MPCPGVVGTFRSPRVGEVGMKGKVTLVVRCLTPSGPPWKLTGSRAAPCGPLRLQHGRGRLGAQQW